jgi:uncharacterized repeat protein (TIGR01451 family)
VATAINGGTSVETGDFNLIEAHSDFDGGIAVTDDPVLGPLAMNGGPTATHALGAGSPALDAGIGTGLTTDQRGVTRPIDLPDIANGNDGSDIGSFEFGMDLAIEKTADVETVTVGGTLTYTITVTNAGPDTATGVEVTDPMPTGLTFVSAVSTLGSCQFDAGTVSCAIGDLPKDEIAEITLVVQVGPAAGSPLNTATVTANEAEVDTDNNVASSATVMVAGDGSLPVAKGKFTISWKSHAKGTAADTLSIAGALNAAGLAEDLTGATVLVTVNQVDLTAATELDAKGKAKSAKGATPALKLALSARKYSFSYKGLDLRDVLGIANESGKGTADVTIKLEVLKAGLVTETWYAALEFAFKTKKGKKTTGKFSFKKGRSIAGAFRASSTKATEKSGGYVISTKGTMCPVGGDILVPLEDAAPVVILTVGAANPIEIPYESLVIGGPANLPSVFSVAKGSVPGISRLTLNNKSRSFVLKTEALTGTGLPPGGQGEGSASLKILIEVITATGSLLFETTIRLTRKKTTSGKWSG